MADLSVYFRPELPGFEHFRASFDHYPRSTRHAHADAVIGIVDDGVQSHTYRGVRHQTTRGGMFFINAGEAHVGEDAQGGGYTYRHIQLNDSLIDRIFDHTAVREIAFKDAAVHSPQLANLFRTALLAVETGQPSLLCDELILESIQKAIVRHANRSLHSRSRYVSHPAIKRAKDFIECVPTGNLSLALLSEIADMTMYHFSHSFRREIGCSPFMYAEAVRIERAKNRLRQGAPLADIAAELEYVDQSHFARKFKQHQGSTPGQYRRATAWRVKHPR